MNVSQWMACTKLPVQLNGQILDKLQISSLDSATMMSNRTIMFAAGCKLTSRQEPLVLPHLLGLCDVNQEAKIGASGGGGGLFFSWSDSLLVAKTFILYINNWYCCPSDSYKHTTQMSIWIKSWMKSSANRQQQQQQCWKLQQTIQATKRINKQQNKTTEHISGQTGAQTNKYNHIVCGTSRYFQSPWSPRNIRWSTATVRKGRIRCRDFLCVCAFPLVETTIGLAWPAFLWLCLLDVWVSIKSSEQKQSCSNSVCRCHDRRRESKRETSRLYCWTPTMATR